MASPPAFLWPYAQQPVQKAVALATRAAAAITSVLFAGGRATNDVVPVQYRITEYLWSKAPDESMFGVVTPTRPFQFEIGAYEVPQNSSFWITDYEFKLKRPSGIDVNDVLDAEEGRGSGFMGWDLTVNGQRLNNIRFELDPSPTSLSREAFGSFANPQAAQFNKAQFNSFAVSAGPGLSLLPVRSTVMGSRTSPFCVIAEPAARVALGAVLFRPITFPVTSFQGRVAGYLVPSDTSARVMKRLAPP